ncbi:hypothetical protein ARMGADRAFT_800895 [Armillaria gallica]|uniref:Uncharacterized protein n=1 Tax=Armillaria gallica TaxID=47427 RepID=A0A2H3DJQ0_ARMGA|nr:hypothetical protein ARMGADRAFT_800895 [Armillaria gallica]
MRCRRIVCLSTYIGRMGRLLKIHCQWMYGGGFSAGEYNPAFHLCLFGQLPPGHSHYLVNYNCRSTSGVRDVLTASEWVQQNIGLFGGGKTKSRFSEKVQEHR